MGFQPYKIESFPVQGRTSPGGRVTDTDSGGFPEAGTSLPWVFDPQISWLAYSCELVCLLDAGMALHKTLPQSNPTPDDFGTIDIAGPDIDSVKGGVSLETGNTTDIDIIQRMASSTYSFVLRGSGLRAGYQIPIPQLVSVGGQNAVPEGRSVAYNRIQGNYMGVPIYFALWELRYMVAGPFQNPEGLIAPVPPNPAYHINADIKLPNTIILPWTVRDQSSTSSPPPA